MSLFEPITFRGVTLRNRIGVSPMCQYSSEDGFSAPWHLVHLGALAAGGSSLVMTEATAVEARGRITPQCLGIYKDEHVDGLRAITEYIKGQGAVPAIQLAHAGRKASTYRPWSGHGKLSVADGAWETIGPSALPFSETYTVPHELSIEEIGGVVEAWAIAARRAIDAGFQSIEIHAAHGYLMHQFFSPLSNKRIDAYGGSFENRIRLTLEIAAAVRKAIPESVPLFARLSCTDWTPDGWSIENAILLSKQLAAEGVDLIDSSSGGNVSSASIPVGPGYQVPFSSAIRAQSGVATGAVGMITDPAQADTIIRTGQADLVFLARALLRNPYWPAGAAKELGAALSFVPPQYTRAW